jgi:hypothetical protein
VCLPQTYATEERDRTTECSRNLHIHRDPHVVLIQLPVEGDIASPRMYPIAINANIRSVSCLTVLSAMLRGTDATALLPRTAAKY